MRETTDAPTNGRRHSLAAGGIGISCPFVSAYGVRSTCALGTVGYARDGAAASAPLGLDGRKRTTRGAAARLCMYCTLQVYISHPSYVSVVAVEAVAGCQRTYGVSRARALWPRRYPSCSCWSRRQESGTGAFITVIYATRRLGPAANQAPWPAAVDIRPGGAWSPGLVRSTPQAGRQLGSQQDGGQRRVE